MAALAPHDRDDDALEEERLLIARGNTALASRGAFLVPECFPGRGRSPTPAPLAPHVPLKKELLDDLEGEMKHLVPVLWLALLIGLGVRGIVADEARYAWGMFPYVLRYEVAYRWRLEDGTSSPFVPGRDIRRAKKVFAPGREHDSMYGVGAIRAELRAYGNQVITDAGRVPAGARAFEIELRFRKHDTEERQVEIIEVPVS